MKIYEILQESINPRDVDILATQVNKLGIDVASYIQNVITNLKDNPEKISGETLFNLKTYADIFIDDFEKSVTDFNKTCEILSVNKDTVSDNNNSFKETRSLIKSLRQELDK